VLDPKVTFLLPLHLTATTVMDAKELETIYEKITDWRYKQ